MKHQKIKVKLLFKWYDFWVGFFWDKEKRRLYIFPIPMFGIRISFYKDHAELLRKVLKAQEVSKKDAAELGMRIDCTACQGSGTLYDGLCYHCRGKGYTKT